MFLISIKEEEAALQSNQFVQVAMMGKRDLTQG